MSNVVFELFAKLGLDSSEYEEGLNDAKDKASSIGGTIAGGLKTVGKAGVAIGAAVAGATVAAGTALVKGAGDVAAYGDNIDKMSQKMGISAQAYQEWDAIMQHSGTSIEALKPSMKTLATQAEKGNEAFQKLGISEKEVKELSQEDLFARVIKGLQGMEEGTERTYITSQLLGRGATELGALLNTSAEDTEKMRQRVHELGGVMSDEAVKAAAAYQDSLQDMQTGFDSLKRNLISEFLPSITGVMDGLTDIFAGDYESGLGKISEGIKSLVNGISEKLPQIIELGSTIIKTLATAIIDNLPTIFEAGMNLILQLGMAIIENLPKIIEIGLQLILTLAQGIVEAIPEIIPAIINVITEIAKMLTNPDTLMQLIEAAISIVVAIGNGIIENIPLLLTSLGDLVKGAIDYLSNSNTDFLSQGVDMIMNLIDGFIENLPEVVSMVAEFIAEFVANIAENLPTIIAQGIEIITQLIVGLIQAIPKLVAAIPQIIQSIVKAFSKFDWKKIGKDILDGIKNGILGAVSAVVSAAKEAATAIWNSIKDFFKISSPSKKMMWIGKMVDEGFAEGITDNIGTVDDAMNTLMDFDGNVVDVPKPASSGVSVLSKVAESGNDNKNLTVILELDKMQLGRAVYQLNNSEMQRVGVQLAGGVA